MPNHDPIGNSALRTIYGQSDISREDFPATYEKA